MKKKTAETAEIRNEVLALMQNDGAASTSVASDVTTHTLAIEGSTAGQGVAIADVEARASEPLVQCVGVTSGDGRSVVSSESEKQPNSDTGLLDKSRRTLCLFGVSGTANAGASDHLPEKDAEVPEVSRPNIDHFGRQRNGSL